MNIFPETIIDTHIYTHIYIFFHFTASLPYKILNFNEVKYMTSFMDSRFPTLLGFFYYKVVQTFHKLILRLILLFNILNYNPSRICVWTRVNWPTPFVLLCFRRCYSHTAEQCGQLWWGEIGIHLLFSSRWIAKKYKLPYTLKSMSLFCHVGKISLRIYNKPCFSGGMVFFWSTAKFNLLLFYLNCGFMFISFNSFLC